MLTNSIDNIVGTAGNDTIIGDFTVTATLNASDQINGGAGTDTLQMFGTYNSAILPATITGIETV